MDLSIVIPALNEATKIRFDAEVAASFIKDTGLNGEVIIVDDGSNDGTAEAARNAAIPSSVKLLVTRLQKNSGKGYAVKTGIEKTEGKIVLFADSGTCVPYANAFKQIERIRAGELDIAIASRRLKETRILRDRSRRRRLLSWLFRQAAITITGLPRRITDSQCGFKLYKGEIARELFSQCQTRGFLFEVEILLRALQKSYRVEEFPVEWTCDLDTRLRPAHIALNVLKELFRIRSIMKK